MGRMTRKIGRIVGALWGKRPPDPYGWFGNFGAWDDARGLTQGYDAVDILKKVHAATIEVREGRAAYERDSVLFRDPDFNWPLVACLMHIAAARGGVLKLVDFGGALGSTYFQNRPFLASLKEVIWCVVEQPAFVSIGKREFESERLRFHGSVAECIREANPQAALFSSVLPYLERPYEVLGDVAQAGLDYILIDRTGFTLDDSDRLTVQRVPPEIYDASYPCWFLSRRRLCDLLAADYEKLVEFPGQDHANIPSTYGGYLFRRRGRSGVQTP